MPKEGKRKTLKRSRSESSHDGTPPPPSQRLPSHPPTTPHKSSERPKAGKANVEHPPPPASTPASSRRQPPENVETRHASRNSQELPQTIQTGRESRTLRAVRQQQMDLDFLRALRWGAGGRPWRLPTIGRLPADQLRRQRRRSAQRLLWENNARIMVRTNIASIWLLTFFQPGYEHRRQRRNSLHLFTRTLEDA